MKRKLTLTVLFVFLFALVSTAISVSAKPIYGDHIFDSERMMQFDEGTRFENGIVNGGIINPGLGTYSTYSGVKFDKETYCGERAVKVELLDGNTTGYLDFNYYQWDADAKKPALDASSYPYFKIRYASKGGSGNVTNFKFWASKETELGKTIGEAALLFDAHDNVRAWTEIIISLEDLVFGDGTTWAENTVRQFRIYPFEGNTDPNAYCYIAGFGFFTTLEEALSYSFETGEYETLVVYDPNGGVGAPLKQIKEDGKSLKLTESIPGRNGYKFEGWATSPTGNVRYKPGDYYRGDKSSILYAVWKADANAPEGDHIFNADRMMQFDEGTSFKNGFVNGGVINPASGIYWDYSGTKFVKTTYKKEPAIKLQLKNGNVNGYLDFIYYYPGEPYSESLNGSKYRYFKIRYAYSDVTNLKEMVIGGFRAPEVSMGSAFGSKTFEVSNGYGEWCEAIVDLSDVTFEDGGVWSESTLQMLRLFPFLDNTNTNATCYIAGMGFFETEEQAKTYNFVSGDYGAYIEYDANGGVGAPEPQIKQNSVSLTLTNAIPAKNGYKFVGWSTNIGGKAEYQAGGNYLADKSVKLYAVWEKDTLGEVKMGEHIFAGDRLDEYTEGTRFHNGFVDGGDINHLLDRSSTYVGVTTYMTDYKGERALRVKLLDGYYTGFLDFNYYQWDADNYEPSLDATKYRYLRIRYAYASAPDVKTLKLWASKDAPILGTTIEAGQKSWSIVNSSEWRDTVIDLKTLKFGDDTFWDECTVRQFRIYPFEGNNNKNATVYISGIGFFETREEAKSYDFATGTFSLTPVEVEEESEVVTEPLTEEIYTSCEVELCGQDSTDSAETPAEEIVVKTELDTEDITESETEEETEETATTADSESGTEEQTVPDSESDTTVSDEEESVFAELIKGNQIVIGIVIGCVIGALIAVLIALILVKSIIKKKR